LSFVLFVAVGAMFITVWGSRNYGPTPFPNPENVAQKIANFVVLNGEIPYGKAHLSEQDKPTTEGLIYRRNVYIGYDIYIIDVGIYEDGQKILEIRYYATNRDFDILKTPADFIAKELENGRPEMYQKISFYDKNIDMAVDICQTLDKRSNVGSYDGFTREEIDRYFSRGKNEKNGFGFRERLYDGGEFLKGGKWVEASPEEIGEIQNGYEEFLSEIAKHLKIK
ncbi:MAG: hypothetical protein Q8L57_00750, partial [bacterium]|nr:hypothetical protein [bacterium]